MFKTAASMQLGACLLWHVTPQTVVRSYIHCVLVPGLHTASHLATWHTWACPIAYTPCCTPANAYPCTTLHKQRYSWHTLVRFIAPIACRNSKAPFTFVVQLMVPGPPFLSLVMAWAADYDPSKPANMDTPIHQTEAHPAFSPRADPDSDSELTQSPFDLCLARYAVAA